MTYRTASSGRRQSHSDGRSSQPHRTFKPRSKEATAASEFQQRPVKRLASMTLEEAKYLLDIAVVLWKRTNYRRNNWHQLQELGRQTGVIIGPKLDQLLEDKWQARCRERRLREKERNRRLR